MAGHHLEFIRCRTDNNWLALFRLWSLTFARRFLCAHVAANVAPTEWLNGLLHLPNTISVPHGLEAIASSAKPPHLSEPPTIVFQGLLVSTKGVPVLLKAARILRASNRSFELVIAGDGPERPALEKLAQKVQLSTCVRFMGRLGRAELESKFAKASIVRRLGLKSLEHQAGVLLLHIEAGSDHDQFGSLITSPEPAALDCTSLAEGNGQ